MARSPIASQRIGEREPLINPLTSEEAGSDAARRWSEHQNDNGVYHGSSQTPRTRIAFRIAAAMYSFVVIGLFQSSIGVMLPPIEQHYHLSDIHVSLIFLAIPVGYILAAQMNNSIHTKFGQRGIASIGPFFHLLAAVIISMHPPFPLLLVGFAVIAFGTGILDGSWCSWAGSMERANTVSGLLHGSFSSGAAAGPFLAGTMMSAGHKPWYNWYYVLIGVAAFEMVVLPLAFRLETGAKYRHEKHAELEYSDKVDLRAIFRHRATWFCAAYFLAYVGTESAISGWVVSFMTRSREASPYLASISSSGFWAGMAIGRLALGFLTDRVGLKLATTIYLLCAVLLEVLFALIKTPVVSIVCMALLGFFMGPLFPSGIVLLARLLPKDLHVAAVSFVSSVGQLGGAFLPFVVGAMIQTLGIRVFQYVLVVQTVVTFLIWLGFSRPTVESSTAEDTKAPE